MSFHANVTNRRVEHLPVSASGKLVLYAKTAEYLGISLEAMMESPSKKEKRKTKNKIQEIVQVVGRDTRNHQRINYSFTN